MMASYKYFFNFYLAVPRPKYGHCWRDSFTFPMLINVFLQFDPRVTGSLVARMGPQARLSAYWDLSREPSDSDCNALTH